MARSTSEPSEIESERPSRRSTRRKRRWAAAGLSVLAHAVLLLALFAGYSPPAPGPATVSVSLTSGVALSPDPPRSSVPAASSEPKRQTRRDQPAQGALRTASFHHSPGVVAQAPAFTGAEPSNLSGVTDQGGSMPGLDVSQLGMASAAESGPPAGPCDMARRAQAALRQDSLARRELDHTRLSPTAAGRTLLVWNGDWVQGSDEEGKGLAAVREAIIWEVGFAPEACRSQRVTGYVLFTLDDAPTALRIALGAPSWRWSDLLGLQARR